MFIVTVSSVFVSLYDGVRFVCVCLVCVRGVYDLCRNV